MEYIHSGNERTNTLGHGGSFEPISESNKSETKDHIALFNLPEASE